MIQSEKNSDFKILHKFKQIITELFRMYRYLRREPLIYHAVTVQPHNRLYWN